MTYFDEGVAEVYFLGIGWLLMYYFRPSPKLGSISEVAKDIFATSSHPFVKDAISICFCVPMHGSKFKYYIPF